MAFFGLAKTNPHVANTMLDSGRWRCLLYADTPSALSRYAARLADKNDPRKVVVFVFGASLLPKIMKDQERFYSVVVFDDVQNLAVLEQGGKDFKIADIQRIGNDIFPKRLMPSEFSTLIESSGGIGSNSILMQMLQSTLGRRKASILDGQGFSPRPEPVPDSNIRSLLLALKRALELNPTELKFQVAANTYARYIFDLTPRSVVTTTVTKLLPESAKPIWQELLSFVSTDAAQRIALAYKKLCAQEQTDYKISHAVREYSLLDYSGDIIYLLNIVPAHREADFNQSADQIKRPQSGNPVKKKSRGWR